MNESSIDGSEISLAVESEPCRYSPRAMPFPLQALAVGALIPVLPFFMFDGRTAVMMECRPEDPDFERHLVYTEFFARHGVPVPALLTSLIRGSASSIRPR